MEIGLLLGASLHCNPVANDQPYNKPGYYGLEMQTATDGVTSSRVLWACDTDGSRKIKYTAPQDDLTRIFNEVLGIAGNTTFSTNYKLWLWLLVGRCKYGQQGEIHRTTR